MKWALTEPKTGDMIRVKAGSVWHYGVFVSDDEVIQFGYAPFRRVALKDSEIEVVSTTIDDFLGGGFLEVAELDRKELKTRKRVEETVALARSRLGERGYSILYNNCEHFANECVFGVKRCSQTEDVRAMFRQMPVCDLYYAEIPDGEIGSVSSAERQKEIDSAVNPEVKRQRFYVWKLLEYALNRTFGYKIDKIGLYKSESGKWKCSECELSLSHSGKIVAVALSRKAVGVDVEIVEEPKITGLENKILSPEEREEFDLLPTGKRADYLIKRWTQKESAYKRVGEGAFLPRSITACSDTETREVEAFGKRYYLSVTGESVSKLRVREYKF